MGNGQMCSKCVGAIIIAEACCTKGHAQGADDAPPGCGEDACELSDVVETLDLGQTRHASCLG